MPDKCPLHVSGSVLNRPHVCSAASLGHEAVVLLAVPPPASQLVPQMTLKCWGLREQKTAVFREPQFGVDGKEGLREGSVVGSSPKVYPSVTPNPGRILLVLRDLRQPIFLFLPPFFHPKQGV